MGFTNSDFARNIDDRRNTSWHVSMLGSGVVSQLLKKQQIVTLSTIEAEYVTTTSCAYQAIWLRKILEELHFKQERPTSIFCDNSSVIKLSKNHIIHGRNKHIDMKYHFLCDLTKDGIIDLIFCRSEYQIANLFTKSLKLASYVKFRKLLGVCKLEDLV